MPDSAKKSLTTAESAFLTAIVLFSAVIRFNVNDVTLFSRADEQVYTNITAELVQGGFFKTFPRMTQTYLASPDDQNYPGPARWGHFFLTTAASRLMGKCDQHTLATVSTAAGIAAVLLTFLIGFDVFGAPEGILAAAFVSTAPLQLALGRRALLDEVLCAAILLALWTFLRVVRNPTPLNYVWSILATTAAASLKESYPLFFPAFALLLFARPKERRLKAADFTLFAVPSALYLAGLLLCTRSFSAVAQIIRVLIAQGAGHNPYAVEYQAGPPHRVLVDYLLLSPIVCVLAAGAVAQIVNRPAEADDAESSLALFLAGILVVFGLLPSKNIRYTAAAEPVMALLAARMLIKFQFGPRRWGLGASIAAALIVGLPALAIFQTVFHQWGVYDPVTVNVVHALHLVPR